MARIDVIREEKPVIVQERQTSNGSGLWIGVAIAVLIILLTLVFGLPYLSGIYTRQSTPSVQIPNKIDVNLHK